MKMWISKLFSISSQKSFNSIFVILEFYCCIYVAVIGRNFDYAILSTVGPNGRPANNGQYQTLTRSHSPSIALLVEIGIIIQNKNWNQLY